MSKAICVMGESGSGKTTAMRTLNPKETFYIDCDGKGMSWKGWRDQYVSGKNYLKTDNQDKVLSYVQNISEKMPFIKVIVIDTINSIMIADERRRMADKGYDKWCDLAWSVYDITTMASRCRDDLTIIMIAHSQTDYDENTGEKFTRILTNGKKLNKIGLEKYFTTVLLCKHTSDGFIMETTANASTAKAPMGAFDTEAVPNDMAAVLAALKDF